MDNMDTAVKKCIIWIKRLGGGVVLTIMRYILSLRKGLYIHGGGRDPRFATIFCVPLGGTQWCYDNVVRVITR